MYYNVKDYIFDLGEIGAASLFYPPFGSANGKDRKKNKAFREMTRDLPASRGLHDNRVVCPPQIPLVIFKREKELARKLEFDGLYITEQPEDDDIKGQWDRLVLNTP